MANNFPLLRNFSKDVIKSVFGITLDFGRQRITPNELNMLCEFGNSKRLLESFKEMKAGKIVNNSEKRAALHTALRDPTLNSPFSKDIHQVLERVCTFATSVRDGVWRGASGESISDVVNVGIGGSEVGPRMVYEALRSPNPDLKLHFLAACDGITFDRITSNLDPFKTLVVISSKSFNTQETLCNAKEMISWLIESGIPNQDLCKHIVLVSVNENAPNLFGLLLENFYPTWDWVGGRFSVWGAVGLPLAIALGPQCFKNLLVGAYQMDNHASSAPLRDNIPALLALFEYWNSNKLGVSSYCFLPYDERLRVMTTWLQQLEMESLGKSRSVEGEFVNEKTSLMVWGGHGNESQHSFFQWLREGTDNTTIDICWCLKSSHEHFELNRVLLANAQAQAEALINRDLTNSTHFNTVNCITIDELKPETLGALMAMYEHKTTMLGSLLRINPFDQPGVEFGKKLAKRAYLNLS